MSHIQQRLSRLEALVDEILPELETEDGGRVRVSEGELLGAFVELVVMDALRTLDLDPAEDPPEYEYLWPDLSQAVDGQSGLVDMMKALVLKSTGV